MKYLLIIVFIILWIYHPWFDFAKTLSGGDWPYLYKENIQEFSLFPQAPFLWLEPYYNLTAKLGTLLSLPWEITEKIFWFIPFIIISLVSSWLFVYSLLNHVKDSSCRRVFSALGSLIYTSNTYILMIVGGGQMGVGMAYAFTPFVFYAVLMLINDKKQLNVKKILFVGVIGGIQLMFDPRFFILTFLCIFIYLFLSRFIAKFELFKSFLMVVFAMFISVAINLFWILPNILSFKDFYNDAALAITVQALSFAQFSNSISLLHPNWPENIFGKIGFMKPEFLVIPILAYSSLLFFSTIKNLQNKNQSKEKLNIVFFSFLAILGAFFAKGVNPPFGEIYVFLSNIPGFLIFRDPTKWYLLIAISYSLLIPYLLSKTAGKSTVRPIFFAIMFLIFWIFTIRQAIFGQLNGTFRPQVLPAEYVKFKDFLKDQPDNFSTLWIPTTQRFGFSSISHPALSGEELFNISTSSALVKEFRNIKTKKILKDSEIRYVVVPYDSRKEIFLKDRVYDYNKRLEIEKILDSIVWLKKINTVNKLAIYQVSD